MAALWICEKYAVASELARVLFGGVASHVPPVIVTKQATRLAYTNGHALELAAPEAYDPAYRSWNYQDIASLVQNGFRLVAAPGKSAAVSAIEKEIRAASEIVVATDAGREGEMIAWEVIEHAGFRGRVRRFWASALTEATLKRAAAALLPAEVKFPLYHAGRARSRADWIEGLTYTRYFTRRHGAPNAKPLSVGRVQSAVTALVEDRCREIDEFVPRTYFDIEADIETPHGALRMRYRPRADQRLEDRGEAEEIAGRIKAKTCTLSLKTLSKTVAPAGFLNTSGAQKRAFGLWNWAPDRTLALLQGLYEAKHITYPRTECNYLTAEHAHQMSGLLMRLAGLPEIAALARAKPDWIGEPILRGSFYDDAKLTDHHAIIPTETIPNLVRLDPDEAKLYQLIVRHTVANLLPDFRYDSATLTALLDGKPFTARGRTVRELGWRTLIPEHEADGDVKRARKCGKNAAHEDHDDDERIQLPLVEDGERGAVHAAAVIAKQTKPPAFFTQASLLDAMVNIDLYIGDSRLASDGASGNQSRGIGTEATRAHILRTMFDRGYAVERGSAIHTTPRGSAFVGLARRLVPWMVDPIHTAEQEAALLAIESGEGSDEAYVASVIARTQKALLQLRETADATPIEAVVESGRPRPGARRVRGRREMRPTTDSRNYRMRNE